MENLEGFLNRFSGSVGCYYNLNRSNVHSLKKFDSDQRGKMGVLGWVLELKRKGLFRVDTYKWLGDEAGVSDLADGVKEGMHYVSKKKDPNGKGTGIFFYVRRGSQEEDYKKAVRALQEIMALR